MPEPKRSVAAEVSKFLGYGLTWALSTILFLFLGSVADGWLGTEPLLTVLGALVGAAAGFYSMIHHLVTVPRRRAAERGEGSERESEGRSDREAE